MSDPYANARKNGQAAAYRARLRAAIEREKDRQRSPTHYNRVTGELRQEREHPNVRWRCECGRIAIGATCACGARPAWAP